MSHAGCTQHWRPSHSCHMAACGSKKHLICFRRQHPLTLDLSLSSHTLASACGCIGLWKASELSQASSLVTAASRPSCRRCSQPQHQLQ